MANQIFTIVCVLYTVSVLVKRLDFVEANDASASASFTFDPQKPNLVQYESCLQGGELIIKLDYNPPDDKKMTVVILYDTEIKSAETFFKEQFKSEIFAGFNKCDVINWNMRPCTLSKIQDGKLNCPQGNLQCKFDKFHACAATLYASDQVKLGSFLICFFNEGKNNEDCATKYGMNYDDLKTCAEDDDGKAGAGLCDGFYRIIHPTGNQSPPPPSGDASTEVTSNFKGFLCGQLKTAQLKCDFCPA
ncbi:uncharacterized protein LOC135845073 [Planococcus citri]|uniref:uncharacterized protein LOC135845073 n=1 Tax=Planococcus citri TaxID=170843 RepID=UPI0031F9276A